MNEDTEIRTIFSESKPKLVDQLISRDSSDPIIRRQSEVRFRFSLGLFSCALFVLVVSLVFPAEDRFMWAGGGLAILAFAAWQLDKSRREGDTAEQDQ